MTRNSLCCESPQVKVIVTGNQLRSLARTGPPSATTSPVLQVSDAGRLDRSFERPVRSDRDEDHRRRAPRGERGPEGSAIPTPMSAEQQHDDDGDLADQNPYDEGHPGHPAEKDAEARGELDVAQAVAVPDQLGAGQDPAAEDRPLATAREALPVPVMSVTAVSTARPAHRLRW